MPLYPAHAALPAPPVLRVQGLPGIPVLYLYSARTYSRRYKDKKEKRKAKQTEQRAAQANKRTREEKATAEATAQVRKKGLSLALALTTTPTLYGLPRSSRNPDHNPNPFLYPQV